MSGPKLHHYVPQFYLRRFVDSGGRLWVWDQDTDRVFRTIPKSIASESNFYLLPELTEQGHDPQTLEHQLSDVESEMAKISDQWLEIIRAESHLHEIPMPQINRETAGLFVVLQSLRTADTRTILKAFSGTSASDVADSNAYTRSLHAELLWHEELLDRFRAHVEASTWVFAKNQTEVPFVTSDNPVAFRTADNRQWIKGGVIGSDAYIVYPLAPDVVLYCYPRNGRWLNSGIEQFDCKISPVELTTDMVTSENSAQVFTASRYVISKNHDFAAERRFATTIGTDFYAPHTDEA